MIEHTFTLLAPVEAADLDRFLEYCIAALPSAGIAGTSALTSRSVTLLFGATDYAVDVGGVQAVVSAWTNAWTPPATYSLAHQTFPKTTVDPRGDPTYRTVLSCGYDSAAPPAAVVVDASSSSCAPYVIRIFDVPSVAVVGSASFSNATAAQNWVPVETALATSTLEVQVSAVAPVQISSIAIAYVS